MVLGVKGPPSTTTHRPVEGATSGSLWDSLEMFNMETFPYDVTANDLGDLWGDSDLDQMTEVFKVQGEEDWSAALLDVKPQVILHDRLMTDAALGTAPIKTEHSYCSLTVSGSDSPPDSPLEMEDIEDDCFPPVKLQQRPPKQRPATPEPEVEDGEEEVEVVIKDEPLSEPESPASSCPPSPAQSPAPRHCAGYKYEQHKLKSGQSVLKQQTVLMSRGHHLMPPLSIKLEHHSSAFTLPPTPPSSTSSDSEGNVSPSHPSSPARRLFLSATNHNTTSTRQPIQTPLISSQPKGSTGVLMLTEEEKRTLLAEGYQIPTRLPLTKAEEKSLKKIRRKIKNKISAQESRRKKKEYMDALERKVELLSSENSEYRKKISSLEDTNCSLVSQLHKLQALVARSHNLTPYSRGAK